MQTSKHGEQDKHVVAQGSVGAEKESLCLPGNRQNRAGDEFEVNGWTRQAKAFQAEGRASAKAQGYEKAWGSTLPSSLTTFLFALFLLLARNSAANTFQLFTDPTPLCY